MKVSKASLQFGQRVFRKCTEGGALNEEKLSKAITFLSKNKPRDYRGILLTLKKLMRLDLEKRTVYVQSAKELSSEESARIAATLTKKHGGNLSFKFVKNPELIGGLKVQIGSQVYDGTVKSKISRLANSL